MGQSRQDTERKVVKCYVPAYQKDEWERHARALDMSQSEFVRTMVQAGRSDLEPPDLDEAGSSGETDATPGVEGLETRILDALREEGALDWDELVVRVTDDVEARLDSALDRLQDDNRVRYKPRQGGYTVIEDGE